METYIAMLRGINVSGQKKILMADLRGYMEELGLQKVETYIQSGNIIFSSSVESLDELASQIKTKISEQYGFEVPTLVKRVGDLEFVLANCPFAKDPGKDISRWYVTFLGGEPDEDRIVKLKEYNYSPEEYVLEGVNIYFYSPDNVFCFGNFNVIHGFGLRLGLTGEIEFQVCNTQLFGHLFFQC